MIDENNKHDSSDVENSADEALCELLGLSSFKVVAESIDDGGGGVDSCPTRSTLDDLVNTTDEYIQEAVRQSRLQNTYETESVCVFPDELSVPSSIMRRLTDELVWSGPNVASDKTYETISVRKRDQATGKTILEERKVLTRLENFVDHHDGWHLLCNHYLRRCISAALGEEYVLFKEKLNLKSSGASGFAPHLDTPSLRVALGDKGPRTFVTVMVAIDGMSGKNGCLRVCRGNWSEENACSVVLPRKDGNPDASGRAGAITEKDADSLTFDDLVCSGGTIAAFNGWMPHRSAGNSSPFPRRAVFLTYNPASEGKCHAMYYHRMQALRNEWRTSVGLPVQVSSDEKAEREALGTIPVL